MTGLPHISRRWWLRVCAASASLAAGYGFSRIAAANDFRMEIFFFLAVTAGLVIVLSGLGGEFDRKRRHER